MGAEAPSGPVRRRLGLALSPGHAARGDHHRETRCLWQADAS